MTEKALATFNNISKDKAWKMIEKYRKHYKGKEFQGAEYLSHGVWFTFNDLEDWIKEAKDENCTGVRIYFATYLDKEDHPHRGNPNIKRNYAHRNTVVLIATKTEGGVERDHYKVVVPDKIFDPLNKGELCPEECGE
ncbi:MAG: hypothetical protein WBJ10_15265 [Daejeonella sp.]|uniref:hypothetical protein n=1 Tax=Daejeonella sp. TaxID=2805397 RepID=UPI003C732C5D